MVDAESRVLQSGKIVIRPKTQEWHKMVFQAEIYTYRQILYKYKTHFIYLGFSPWSQCMKWFRTGIPNLQVTVHYWAMSLMEPGHGSVRWTHASPLAWGAAKRMSSICVSNGHTCPPLSPMELLTCARLPATHAKPAPLHPTTHPQSQKGSGTLVWETLLYHTETMSLSLISFNNKQFHYLKNNK